MADQQLLQQISQGARHLMNLCSRAEGSTPRIQSFRSKSLIHEALSYSLPRPQPVTSYLVSLGYRSEVSERLSRIYLRCAFELKEVLEVGMRSTLKEWSQVGFGSDQDARTAICSLQAAYRHRFEAKMKQILSGLVDRLRLHACSSVVVDPTMSQTASSHPSSQTDKSSFKAIALPVLTEAFAENPYPTRNDKERLAQATGMEYKQIHVWFQNRRNRVKKDGHSLTKCINFNHMRGTFVSESAQIAKEELPCIPLEKFNEELDGPHLSLPDRARELAASSISATNAARHHELDPLRPAHAYPSPYPPICHYDPFPSPDASFNRGWSWPRHRSLPQQQEPTRLSAGAVDDLIAAFEKLAIIDKEPAHSQGFAGGESDQACLSPSPTTSLRVSRSALSDSPEESSGKPSLSMCHPRGALEGATSEADVVSHNSSRDTRSRRRSSTPAVLSSLSLRFPRDIAHPYCTSSRRRTVFSRSSSISSVSSTLSELSSSGESSAESLLLTPPSLPGDLPESPLK
ncbi:A2 mating-type protein [Phanerochaete sordida]|uniref:A2 mating-type protein n=1 Tax=Phanerochaete sordida TaxID=48140 RepID=A0A9P3L8T4_9APHY|nr:A2 mating-type protein [Phanerochaete sordida]